MANMVNMYEGKSFSPSTILTQGVNDTATRIYVEDVSVFPDAPNLAVIGTTGVGEVVKYYAKGLDFLDGVERGVDGVAQSWSAGDAIARNFTKTDYEALRQNITTLNEDKIESADVADIQIVSVEAGAKANIDSGDTIAVAFGKLRKWFTSFKALAWLDAVGTAQITDKNVTNAKLANMAAKTIKGNLGTTSAAPSDVTMLDVVEYGLSAGTTATTVADAEYVPLSVSATSTKKITWANVKAVLKTYFDTLYATAANITTAISAHDSAGDAHSTLFAGKAAASHTHGSITNDGKIGNTADLPVFTGTGGTVGTKTVAAARNLLGLGNTSGALPVANGGTGATSAAAALTNLGVAPAVVTITKTLAAASWASQQQTITDAAIKATSPGDLRIAQSATDAQAEAWGKSMPRVVAQAAGSITIRAAGEVPTINIPIILEVRG